MKSRHPRKPLHDAPPKVRRPPGSPSKSQLQAIAAAEARARAARWKTLIPAAGQTWSKIHPTELGRTNGDIHMLAGMVQMRYQLNRQEADSQVQAFFAAHAAPAAVS